MEIKDITEHKPDTNLWLKRDSACLAVSRSTGGVVLFRWTGDSMCVIFLKEFSNIVNYYSADTFNQAFKPFQGELTLVQKD